MGLLMNGLSMMNPATMPMALANLRAVASPLTDPGGHFMGGGNYSGGGVASAFAPGGAYGGVGRLLSPLAMLGGGIGGGVGGAAAMAGGGMSAMAMRSGPIAQWTRGEYGMIASGRSDGRVNPALYRLGGNGQGNPLSTGLSPAQAQMLSSIEDPAAQKRMAIQFALQNQAEVASFCSNVMKLLHEMSTGIIRNITS